MTLPSVSCNVVPIGTGGFAVTVVNVPCADAGHAVATNNVHINATAELEAPISRVREIIGPPTIEANDPFRILLMAPRDPVE
jgi:hypothetical protein